MGHDSCWGGDSGGGGGNPPFCCPPSHQCCPSCGDPYPVRCGCNKRPCPVCGVLVFFHGEHAEAHACGERKGQPEGLGFLSRFGDFVANELARARLEGFEEGYRKGVRDTQG